MCDVFPTTYITYIRFVSRVDSSVLLPQGLILILHVLLVIRHILIGNCSLISHYKVSVFIKVCTLSLHKIVFSYHEDNSILKETLQLEPQVIYSQ